MFAVIALIAGYLALVLILGMKANNLRADALRLVADLERLPLTPAEQRTLKRAIVSGDSWRTSLLGALAYAQGMIMSPGALKREADDFFEAHPNLVLDPAFYLLLHISRQRAYAVSPLVACLAIVTGAAFRLKLHLSSRVKEEDRVMDLRVLSAA